MYLRMVLVMAIIATAQAVSISPIWSGSNLFLANTYSVITSTAKTGTLAASYGYAFSANPMIFAAIPALTASPGSVLQFDVTTTSVTATGITIGYTVGASTTISQLKVSIMSIATTNATSFITINHNIAMPPTSFPTINSTANSGYRIGIYVVNYTMVSNKVMNISNKVKIIIYVQGIAMQCNTDTMFNATVVGNFINANNYSIVLSTSGNVTVTKLRYSRFIYDQTLLQATLTTFVDSGYVIGKAANWSQLSLTLPWKTPPNFVVGLNSLIYPIAAAVNFTYDPTLLTCSGSLNFTLLSLGYWNYRSRVCPAGYPLFSGVTNLCYDSCDPYFYYLAANQICESCYYSCFYCDNMTSSSTCTSCNPLDFRTLNGTVCSCLPGYFDMGVAICVTCNYTCATCTNNTGCTSCSSSNMRSLASGLCPCSVGYVDNGTATCLTCSTFLVGCIACSSTTVCTTCDSVALFALNGSICSCQTGFYLSGTTCLPCTIMNGCTTCTSATVCTTCSTPLSFVLSSGSCVCANGTYDSAGVCLLCPSSCTTCTSPTVCTGCIASLMLNSGICTCTTGQYMSAGGVCLSCVNSILGCLDCIDNLTCTVCDTAANFTLSATTCVCQVGYYQSGVACIACSHACLACTATACTSCSAPFVIGTAGACSCATGTVYNSSTNLCALPPGTCPTGQGWKPNGGGGGGSCVTCPSMINNCALCDNNTCYSCNAGFYLASATTCTACPQGCAGCVSPTNCTTCKSNFYFNNGACNCQYGFAVSSGSCVACTASLPGCLNCTSTTVCVACDTISNFVTDPANSSRCACIVGFYLASGTCSSCAVALTGCVTCANATKCNTCNTVLFFNLTGTTCACMSGYYYSAPGCLPCPVGCTVCDATGTTCTACDTASGFSISGSVCACNASLYLPASSSICFPCTNLFWACTACIATGCTGCTSPAVPTSGACTCPSGFYNDTVTCQSCSSQILGCVTCILGSCQTCDTTLNFDGAPVSGACVCLTGLVQTGSTCVNCSVAILGCATCTDAATCTTCDATLFFELSGVQCVCMLGYFLNSTNNCQLCSDVLVGCAACTDNSTCTDCPLPMILMPNNNCGCQPTYILKNATCVYCMVDCVCYGYHNISGVCTTLCSDGITIDPPEACDDGNLLPGDGCDTNCSFEPGFNCFFDDYLLAICTKNPPLSFILVSTMKNPTSNSVTFTFSITPAPELLNDLDFSLVTSTDVFPGTQLTYSYDGNGLLTVVANYNTSVQGQNMTLTFNPANVGGAFLALSAANISFVINPDNNLAADYNDDATYSAVGALGGITWVVLAGSIVAFAASMYFAKFIGIEMIGVIQIAYIGLMTIFELPPLMASMTNLSFTNGYNQAYEAKNTECLQIKHTMEIPITSLSYLAPMIYSLNYSLILLFLPVIAWLGFFIASKSKKIDEAKRDKLILWSWLALGEWGLTAVMFIEYHSVASLVLFALYDGTISGEMMGLSIIDALIVFGLTIAALVLFKLKPEHFGDYRKAFKPNTISQYHYFLIAGSRLLLAAILVGANSSNYVDFIGLVIPLTGCIYIAVKKPYKLLYNNIRASINEGIVFATLVIYGYLRAIRDKSNPGIMSTMILPVFEVLLLLGCLVMNSVFVVKYWIDSRKPVKEETAKDDEPNKKMVIDDQVDKILELTNERLNKMISKALFQGAVSGGGRMLSSPAMRMMQAQKLELKRDPEGLDSDSGPRVENIMKRINLEEKLLDKKKQKPTIAEANATEQEVQQILKCFSEI